MSTSIRKSLKTLLNAFYGIFLNYYVVTYYVYRNSKRVVTVERRVRTYSKARACRLIENNVGGKYRAYPHLKFKIIKVQR